jgi:hypothetical protein
MVHEPGELDLSDRGNVLERFWKWLRGTFLLNWLLGWEILDTADPERACVGHISQVFISGDGDIVMYVTDLGGEGDCRRLMNEGNTQGLVCEIPLGDRPRFDNLHLLRRCLTVTVRGRWVLDRAHGWHELHPVSRLDIYDAQNSQILPH